MPNLQSTEIASVAEVRRSPGIIEVGLPCGARLRCGPAENRRQIFILGWYRQTGVVGKEVFLFVPLTKDRAYLPF